MLRKLEELEPDKTRMLDSSKKLINVPNFFFAVPFTKVNEEAMKNPRLSRGVEEFIENIYTFAHMLQKFGGPLGGLLFPIRVEYKKVNLILYQLKTRWNC